MTSKLVKSIVEPRGLAKFLNWNKGSSILCLDITDREIGLAVADNPSPGTEVHKLNPLSYTKAKNNTVKTRQELKETVYDKLDEIVKENNIGGIVVAWPTLSGGRAGGSCGKVLHLLDYIADHNGSLLSKNRPFTLWDTHNVHKESPFELAMKKDVPPDQWGRSVVFSRVPRVNSNENLMSSSDQKFHHTSTKHLSAEKILESYIDSHWANNARRNRAPKPSAVQEPQARSQESIINTENTGSMECSMLL